MRRSQTLAEHRARVRRSRRIGLALGVVVAVAIAVVALRPDDPRITGLPFFAHAHRGEPFAEALFAEHAGLRGDRHPELLTTAADLDGRFTHVRDRVRRSWSSDGDGPTVWFVGGSALFGIGQRDDHTIPSEVAKLAAGDGVPLRAVNLGMPGYLSWQEAGLVREELDRRPPPDLIVVYDGVNDLGAICHQLARGVRPDALGDPLAEPAPDPPRVSCVTEWERTARLTARAVERSLRELRSAAGDVPVVHFWQPFVSTRRTTENDGPLLRRLGLGRVEERTAKAVPYRAAAEQVSPRPVDLTDALDSVEDPVYFDWAHTNELGARLVADAMWERGLREAVAALRQAGDR